MLSYFSKNIKYLLSNWHFYIFLILIFLYLFWNTGIHSDDYSEIIKNKTLSEFFDIRRRHELLYPGGYYLFWWAYYVLGFENQILYDLIKCLTHLVSLYLIYLFARDYLNKNRAFLASIFFLFYPIHDSANYMYMTIPYILTPSLILYSHHLFRLNNLATGFVILIFASLLNYSSPAYIMGLSAIFFIEKKYKKGIIFFLPSILYVAYFFIVTTLYNKLQNRISHDLDIAFFIKNLLIQIFSLIDTLIGPSFWLKIYYSIISNGYFSLFLSLLVICFFYFFHKRDKINIPFSLIIGLFFVLIASCIMFAITGMYLQTAFNLGNRVTLPSSLFVAFILALIPFSRKYLILISIIIILPTFGLSQHWKSWNIHQINLIKNINNNNEIQKLNEDDILLITGNKYSLLGPFSHIEFFCQTWILDPIINNNNLKKIFVITSYVKFENNNLVDTKNNEFLELTKDPFLYDSEKNILKKIKISSINELLILDAFEKRHWIQTVGNQKIKSLILYLSPRLEYLFKE